MKKAQTRTAGLRPGSSARGSLFCFDLLCFGQHEGQLCGGGTFAVHIGRGLAHAHRAALFHQLAVQGEHVAGGDLLAEAGIFDAAELADRSHRAERQSDG